MKSVRIQGWWKSEFKNLPKGIANHLRIASHQSMMIHATSWSIKFDASQFPGESNTRSICSNVRRYSYFISTLAVLSVCCYAFVPGWIAPYAFNMFSALSSSIRRLRPKTTQSWDQYISPLCCRGSDLSLCRPPAGAWMNVFSAEPLDQTSDQIWPCAWTVKLGSTRSSTIHACRSWLKTRQWIPVESLRFSKFPKVPQSFPVESSEVNSSHLEWCRLTILSQNEPKLGFSTIFHSEARSID